MYFRGLSFCRMVLNATICTEDIPQAPQVPPNIGSWTLIARTVMGILYLLINRVNSHPYACSGKCILDNLTQGHRLLGTRRLVMFEAVMVRYEPIGYSQWKAQ